MKLSRFGPKSRTVFIASIVFMLALAFSGAAFARELRVTTAADLVNCAAGAALGAGPDAGSVSAPGDTCVLLPGTYVVVQNVNVTLQNLTIRSSNGPTATVVNLNNFALIIQMDGVTIGGPKADQGITFINGNFAGAIRIVPAAVGQADENITIQYNIIRNGLGPGIVVLPPTSVELFKIFHNTIRDNAGAGIAFLNGGSVGRRGQDRNVVIEKNFFENNFGDNILFGNAGSVEQTAILDNEIYRAFLGSGIHFGNNGEVRDSLIVGNMIQFNNFMGILFNNTGRVDNMLIRDNTGATLDQGITRNMWGGIYFVVPVTELRDVTVEGNNINSNQNAAIPFIIGNGVFTFIPGDIEGLALTGNNIRQNCSNGFLKLFGGDLVRSSFDSNKVFNNGFGILAGCPVVGPSAGLIAINTTNNIQDNAFSGNEFRENSLTGVTLFTTTGDISRLSFTNDKFVKNSIRGLSVFAAATGDIADITASGIEVLENQAGPGTGADIRTWTGDMESFAFSNSKFENNGGFGLRVISLGAPPNRGDIDLVTISNSQFNFNGTRAPVGLGSGAFLAAESIRRVEVSNTRATNNNDHGFSTTASRDLSELKFTDGEFSNNDRNVDTIGNGLDVSVNEAADNILVSGSKINSNNSGVKITAQDRIGRNITIEKNPEINDNRDAGVDLFSGRDLADVKVSENSFARNAIGIRVDVHDRGSNISFTKNDIYGKDGVGIGVLLNSTGVTISDCNKIRRNATGIEVRKVRDNAIHRNTIARNENFGVDATALSPGTSIDATNNWWGEPSGPKHATNPNGIGDRVTDKVIFDPWLTEPPCPLDFSFDILSFTGPTEADKGVSVQYVGEIKNSGTEEGTQEITLTVTKKADGTVVGVKSVTKTINPQAATTVTFDYKFTEGGDFVVELKTNDDSKTINVHVTGAIMLTIEQAVAQHSGNPTIIEDPDITWAVELWVEDTIVPGTDGLKIDDAKILELVGMWIDGTPVAMAAGQGAQSEPKKGFNLFDWLGSFFAARSAVEINPQASPSRVAPGEAFTVTVAFNGEVKGLLLTESLPAGWTITPVENSSAFYKPSQQKWLLLGAGTVAYKVTVPADAAPGSYAIAGSYTTSDGTGAVRPLTVEVAGSPVALKVEAIKFTGSRFVVEGVGIASVEARVWNLAGKMVFHDSASGNVLTVNGPGGALANGVYLYAVTVRGADGKDLQTEVRKMVVLR